MSSGTGPHRWPQLELPAFPWPRPDSSSPLLLASISETAAGARSQYSSLSYLSPQQPHLSASPRTTFTKAPGSLLLGSCASSSNTLQDPSVTFVFRQKHASRLLHLPKEAARQLLEAVHSSVLTVSLGVLSSPPARHIQELHSTLLGQDSTAQPSLAGRGLALLQALHLPRFLHLGKGKAEEKVKVLELSEDPKKAALQLHVKGLEFERAFDLEAAAKCYEQASRLDPTNPEWICRWSKQLTDRTYVPGTTNEEVREVNLAAMQLADQALALAPNLSMPHIAACISRGRLAMFSDNKLKATLAVEAQQHAADALALAPQDDLAHHLIGRWHYEMAGQNLIVRMLVKILFGADLPPGNYPDALRSFQTAIELRPDRVVHWIELGRTEVKLGRPADAMEHLRKALELDTEDINAHQEKEIGLALLKQLEQEAGRQLPWG